MVRLKTAIGAVYAICAVFAIIGLIMTSVNYTLALETNVKFHISIDKEIYITDKNSTPSLVVPIRVENPSRLSVLVTYVDYTVYLYNKSRMSTALNPHQAIALYCSYNTYEIKENCERTLTFIQDISDKKSDLEWIYERDDEPRIDYRFSLHYKIAKFPDWEVRNIVILTYQETSSYG